MTERAHLTAAQIRERVGHPIVDADGHFMEFMPLVDDEIVSYLEEEGGAALRDRFLASQSEVMDTAVFADRRCGPRHRRQLACHAVVVGQPGVRSPRPRHRLSAPVDERAARGAGHRLHVDLSVVDPGVHRDPATMSCGPRCAGPPTATSPASSPGTGTGSSPPRSSRCRRRRRRWPRSTSPPRSSASSRWCSMASPIGPSARAPRASTSSASTARSTTTRCGPPAWTTTWLPPSTAPCRATIRAGRSPTTSTTTSTGSPARIRCSANPCSSAVSTGGSRSCGSGFSRVGSPGPRALLADLIGHWDKRGGHAIGGLDPANLDVEAVLELVDKYGSPGHGAQPGPHRCPSLAAAGPPGRARRVRPGRDHEHRGHPRAVRESPLLRVRGGRSA